MFFLTMFVLLFSLLCFLPDPFLGHTLHVALPSGTGTLVRHYILIPFLFGCVYQAGNYFVAENQTGKGVHGTLQHWGFKSFM